jgi:hypothetical protein
MTMWDYMQPKDGPVVDGLESQEIVYAEHQPQYIPLRTLRGSGKFVPVISRWSPTEEQRKLIADGADIYLELSTFGHPLTPIRMVVSDGKLDNDWVRVCVLGQPALGDVKTVAGGGGSGD